NTTQATDEQIASTERWITKQQNATGIIDDELRPALSTLLRATGDQTKAQNLLTIAEDVSVGAGKDLGAVAVALGKAYNGNSGQLSKMGIATKDATGKALAFDDILTQLQEKFGG